MKPKKVRQRSQDSSSAPSSFLFVPKQSRSEKGGEIGWRKQAVEIDISVDAAAAAVDARKRQSEKDSLELRGEGCA